ncbi:hypothetical protein CMI38_07020 [Candidatus Pacearchaeota archaeon]|nr:hypothetical protein [Candidatus Pacearchaeota archaeon]
MKRGIIIGIILIVVIVAIAGYFIFNSYDGSESLDSQKETLIDKDLEESSQQLIEEEKKEEIVDDSLVGVIRSNLDRKTTNYEEAILEFIGCLDKDKITECPDELKRYLDITGASPPDEYSGLCKEIRDCNDVFMDKRTELLKSYSLIFGNSNFEEAFDKCYVNAPSHKETEGEIKKIFIRDNFEDCYKGELEGIEETTEPEVTEEETTDESCVEDWSCSNWGSCSNGQQTRTCTDSNSCGTTVNKPTEMRICEVETQDPCGDGTCATPSENALNCWTDCKPEFNTDNFVPSASSPKTCSGSPSEPDCCSAESQYTQYDAYYTCDHIGGCQNDFSYCSSKCQEKGYSEPTVMGYSFDLETGEVTDSKTFIQCACKAC